MLACCFCCTAPCVPAFDFDFSCPFGFMELLFRTSIHRVLHCSKKYYVKSLFASWFLD